MATRKEIKQEAVARVKAEREAKRAWQADLKAMPAEDRKAAKAAYRAEAKAAKREAKQQRKTARAGMTRAERREDKRRERVHRKVKHRPRRAIGWTAAVAIIVVIAVIAAPTVADISRLLSIKVDTTTAEGAAAREHGAVVAEQISDEGIVLLKNDGALPLAAPKVNVFSFASFNLRYGGNGSGGSDQSSAVSLYDALEQQGVEYNPDLYASMQDAGAKTEEGSNGLFAILAMFAGAGDKGEPAPDYLTDDVMAAANDYSDTAMIVIGNDGVESTDMTAEQLTLTDEQKALFERVTGTFDNVIVVVNSGNQMELGFLDEYPQITGAVWIGTPGPRGAVSLAKVLTGNVNPSGHLTDTYAYDVDSAPATVNFGDFRYKNADRGFLDYAEGIYVGYRYYETRYVDDEAGYQAAVQYPFGYGLSYTDFDWTASAPVVADGTVSVDVTVRNTGDVAGKDVVQVYGSAPYTPGGVEKSAIELAGYAKTSELAPGVSETVTVKFALRDLASWNTDQGAYVLDAGDYEFSVSTDVHSPIATFTHAVAESAVYDTDETTGEKLQNRFGYAEGDVTYLSRADWDGTYPAAEDRDYMASEAVLEAMDPEIEPAKGEEPTYGADNGLKLEDLKDLDYDDAKWDEFLDQFTLDEQIELFAKGSYETAAVERLGVPAATLFDSPSGLSFFFGNVTAAAYPTEVVVAATWNDALAVALGESVGAEANAYGVEGWYAPAMNLHRTPMGGRDFEYFSEDPLISGKMAAGMISGAQSKNVLTFMKHFALNEQEINARLPGVNVFASEQALRELYLSPFEISVKEGGAMGAMSSFINIGGSWSGGNEQLLQEVLRGEWGFDGVVSTDAVIGGFMDPALAVRHGNDLMLAMLPSATEKAVKKAHDEDPVGIGNGLRDRVHAVMYAVLQTELFR
ncbi:glycoside hydrolase family 3 protein [Microbacterium sp. H1-D42]|uniref:glycoside hydrolase family 3 protein n=1 Tax=Microbacterium sp. H1-D42 TaxID=2925844 RepID=UPI001F532AEC|nr:glycoside hydrolase family 3 protein [Microbacterium sp. H1-D42]UNK71848.1 glycoside hydrolase family 3 C-terminal domain-containing protein [Microbacterium sp. H1-D42]